MVSIKYTGTDGRTTAFGVNSPKEAMSRLCGIKGYKGNIMDSAAAGLAEGFAARHKNAARVAGMTTPARTLGLPSSGAAVFGGGTAARVSAVSDVSVDDEGNIVATKRDEYVGSDGRVAAVGKGVPTSLGKVGVSSVDKNEDGTSAAMVMTGLRYDEESHNIIAIMGSIAIEGGKLRIKREGEVVVTTAVEETVV